MDAASLLFFICFLLSDILTAHPALLSASRRAPRREGMASDSEFAIDDDLVRAVCDRPLSLICGITEKA
jgi:hypothetical protein